MGTVVKCPDCHSSNIYFYYHEYVNCGADDKVTFEQNKKGEWLAKFPKLTYDDITQYEYMGCRNCTSEFIIDNCHYEDENGDYQNECFPEKSKSEEV